MASEALFQALAQALSQPSKAYKAAQEGLGIPGQAIQGYETGVELADKIRQRKISQQSLYDSLGGRNVPDLQGLEKLPGEQVKQFSPLANFQKKLNPDILVLSQEDALKMGKVPRGSKIISPSGETVTYVGNTEDGKMILMGKTGSMTTTNPPGGGSALPKTSTMPTSTTRGSAEFATALIPHINEMRNLIQQADARGYIGPAAGRIYGQFLAGKVGTTGNADADALLGKLRTTDSLIKSGMLRTHFGARGGQQMYENFSGMLNSGKQTSAMMNGSLDAMQSFLKGYSEAGNTGQMRSPEQSLEQAGTGDPEADLAIQRVMDSNEPESKKQAAIMAIKQRASQR